MRSLFATSLVTLVCLAFGGALTVAQAPASPGPDETEQAAISRSEAVSLVLASDPRFADLPDYELLLRKARQKFDMMSLLGSDYYRVAANLATEMSEYGLIVLRDPGSWLIEVTLARDCVELGDTGPWPDPCGWRHSWYHRVEPDGTVTLLFDEGDPEPMPDRVEPTSE